MINITVIIPKGTKISYEVGRVYGPVEILLKEPQNLEPDRMVMTSGRGNHRDRCAEFDKAKQWMDEFGIQAEYNNELYVIALHQALTSLLLNTNPDAKDLAEDERITKLYIKTMNHIDNTKRTDNSTGNAPKDFAEDSHCSLEILALLYK